jgi:segregation and condensation protein B
VSDLENVGPIVEALIFAANGPVSAAQLRRAVPDVSASQIAEIVKEVNQALETNRRPYEICDVAGGYQFRTRPEFAPEIRAMQPERKLRLSRAALETLAVIAYRQPTTRAEIEDLRCVDCGAVLKSLMDRSLVRIVGRRDAVGRPVLYGTSSNFLETFGLRSLRDLPDLRDVEALEEEQGTPARKLAAALISGPEDGPAEIPEARNPAREEGVRPADGADSAGAGEPELEIGECEADEPPEPEDTTPF